MIALYLLFSHGFFKTRSDFKSSYPDLQSVLLDNYTRQEVCTKFVSDRVVRNLNVSSPSGQRVRSAFFLPVTATFSKKKCVSGLVNDYHFDKHLNEKCKTLSNLSDTEKAVCIVGEG